MSETHPEAPQNAPATSLNITDIADAVKIMDYASEQGAFRGWANIRQILLIRDRLDQFVTSASGATEEQKAEEIKAEEQPSLLDNLLPPPRLNRKNHQA